MKTEHKTVISYIVAYLCGFFTELPHFRINILNIPSWHLLKKNSQMPHFSTIVDFFSIVNFIQSKHCRKVWFLGQKVQFPMPIFVKLSINTKASLCLF
jgi:hypothetical protein